jgi:pSer/pThr/pTyr-binding forkhead associated (FHA) protein
VNTRELVELARASSREEFIARVPARFLVLGAGVCVDGEQPISFATRVFKEPSKSSLGEQLTILPLVKVEGNPYADRVSLGRARNCDVVIRDPSISKLHAWFRVAEDSFAVLDVGSQNGTFVNGRRLLGNESVELACNDEIVLGAISASFTDAAGLYAVLKATAAADEGHVR